MDSEKQQIVDGINSTSNILVTVSTNPSVDELSAALGLTLLLDKADKRATAVFSGEIPPAIQFLDPDKTFESTADSLRDFIIALNKEKADHLRYKVDGDVVKIFITPYKTNLSEKDLEFSQGDYNVEMIIGLGVSGQDDLDKALEAHGKILHDAKVVTITSGAEKSSLGSTDWHSDSVSSLSEMVVGIADALNGKETLIDEQIATALLTGIVSATDRFSNDKTTPGVMTVAAQLMAQGANQQLIAAKLEEANDIGEKKPVADVSQQVEAEPVVDKQAQATDESSLTIDRSSKQSSPPESVIAADGVSEDSETVNQDEFEKHLAELNVTPGGTMADIENELKSAAGQQNNEEVVQDNTPSSEPEFISAPVADVTQLDFEPAEIPAPATVVSPVIEQPPVTQQPEFQAAPTEAQQVTVEQGMISQHTSPMSTAAPADAIPFNATVNGQMEESAFSVPSVYDDPNVSAQQQMTADPAMAAPTITMPTEPTPPVQAEPVVPLFPPLPPLPPMPGDVNLPPLPPPPVPPTFEPGPVQAGAVSGDIFGDAASNVPTAVNQPTPPVSEPGQFKIPGQ